MRVDRYSYTTVGVGSAGLHRSRWNSAIVDSGVWYFAEHRCPRMALEFPNVDAHEHSPGIFASASPRHAPKYTSTRSLSVLRNRVLRNRSTVRPTLTTPPVPSPCKRRRNTDSSVSGSCRLRQICHVAGWCPSQFYPPHANVTNDRQRYNDDLLRRRISTIKLPTNRVFTQ